MPGLDPGIQSAPAAQVALDCRIKSGNDNK
jgi:hypothetical protein